MINYDTIKSVYDDKLTLMQWLNKVQEALKDATAVSFNVNKTGDATLTFSILFDDGTELETAPIVIEQGESVESATLRNGHLILTLTNGDELDAGNMGAVSSFSINASQHLIVTYQDGSTNDLGAIFTGNVTINGDLTAVNVQVNSTLKTNYIEPNHGSDVNINGNLSMGSGSALTSSGSQIDALKPVVETLTGYEYVPVASGENINKEIVYAGIAKNGNKLTFVVCAKLTKTATISQQGEELCKFYVPLDIGAKLIPTQIGVYSFLDVRQCLLSNNQLTGLIKPGYVEKNGAQYLRIFVVLDDNLVTDRKYYVRYEVTFLLGENLAA